MSYLAIATRSEATSRRSVRVRGIDRALDSSVPSSSLEQQHQQPAACDLPDGSAAGVRLSTQSPLENPGGAAARRRAVHVSEPEGSVVVS